MARASRPLAGALLAAPCAGAGELRDLYFGEALYDAYQGKYFDALERLDAELAQYHGLDEPARDTLTYHVGQAEFSVGDFELNYRMHHRAGRAIKRVLEGDVEESVRNEAAYRLARIHFQKGQLPEALHALDRIQGTVPGAIRDDVEFLRANVYLASGRPGEAVDVLERLQGAKDLTGFAAYNLGIALLQAGRPAEALEQLDAAGRIAARDKGTAAIRDKSNLVLGDLLFESSDFDRAQSAFDRVQLEGPFSNQALLRAGWSAMSAERYDRALVPWSLLVDRAATDAAVEEALLALPYAYSKLEIHGRAALLYGRAVESFGQELRRGDASIESIRAGRFLQALVREEIRQDKDWVIRLRSLPETPETYYLMTLMASHDFQTSLQNYLDLDDVRRKLVGWQRSFDAYEDLIRLRRANYEPLLPGIDAQFRELDSQIRLRQEQRKHVQERLHALLTAPRPEQLATADERIAAERLDTLAQALPELDPQAPALEARIARLRGALTWSRETRYHERLTEAYRHLAELEADVAAMTTRYESFVRARQAATHSYAGYDQPINGLRRRVGEALQKIGIVQARQGRVLELVAIEELGLRRDRLEAYQAKARYAVADSYDRATRVQGDTGGGL
jgi:hypothetical protein